MNILIVSESFYPQVSGVAVMAERLAAQMAARGHTISVVAPSGGRAFSKEERKGYTIYRIPSWPNPFRRGFRFTLVPERFVRRVFAEVNPELVHAQDPAGLCTAAVRLAHHSNIPIVMTNHLSFEYILTYLPFLKPIHPIIRIILRRTIFRFYSQCDILTVPTETIRRRLIDENLNVPIHVVSNGVDMSRFSLYYRPTELLHRFPIPRNTPLVTYVGRMDPEKNLPTLLKAFAVLRKEKKSKAHLLMVGGGNDVADLQLLAQQLEINKDITWIPKIDNSSVLLNQVYEISTVFCIPSPIETESMVTMEAMASGLPIVAAAAGALTELVVSEENGYACSPYEVEEWAEAIQVIISDPEKRKEMSLNSLERIAQRDLNKTLDQFEKLYEIHIKKKLHVSHPASL